MRVKFKFSWSDQEEEIEITGVGGIDMSDYPRFCDAYIDAAKHVEGGLCCNDEQLNEMNADPDLIMSVLEYNDWFVR